MGFRVVWRGRFGDESSQLIDELERARVIADSLALRYKTLVYVIDAVTERLAYLASGMGQTRPAKPRRGPRPKRPPTSM